MTTHSATRLAAKEQQAQDHAEDGHHHVWLSDGRCATPRCRALKGASTVAEEAP